MMASWSVFREKGLLNLWREFFVAGFRVGFEFENYVYIWDSLSGITEEISSLPEEPVFLWESRSGFVLALYASKGVDLASKNLFVAYLEYETLVVDTLPSFLPFLPAVTLFDSLKSPPRIVFLNGQPGTGKRSVLQVLALRHGGCSLLDKPSSFVEITAGAAHIFIVPEIALLEVHEQQVMEKHIASGGVFWGASVYNLEMLQSRQILSPALSRILLQNRFVLPSLSAYTQEELGCIMAFWRSFYGVTPSRLIANLDYQKDRTLGNISLSVESILEEGRGLRGVVAEFEKEAILKAHARVGRSQHKIAKLLNISRGSLQHKLRKYRLESYTTSDADSGSRDEE